jgi:hypothetical protein
MRKHAGTRSPRTRIAAAVAVAAAVVAGGTAVAAKATSGAATASAVTPPVSLAAAQKTASEQPATQETITQQPAAQQPAAQQSAATKQPTTTTKPKTTTAKKKPAVKLPAGRATATSFWDPQTASGKPMRYQTIASPYWPLGTKVKVTYGGQSRIGYVEDFGPAEWAVAQHDIPAILDLSERMMADLTGTRSNSVHVKFEILKWGSGRVYRHSGTGYSLAMGK